MNETETVTGCDECGTDDNLDEDTLHNGRLLCIFCSAYCLPTCVHITI